MTAVFRTRFAPSPTGLLHLGNVRTALFNWLLAHRHRGRFLLRIEDTDAMRGHERYTLALMEDLRWLGLDWQEGPAADGAAGPYLQSERGAIYRQYFERLHAAGRAYPCFCSEHELSVSRKTALAAGRPPRYSGKCRSLEAAEVQARFAAGTPATLRFRVEDGRMVEFNDGVRGPQRFASDDIGDFIIRRSDGTPAFFFCNAIDDALMGITLVVRGEDHLTNTPRQLLLLEALGLPKPDYAHIALVVGDDGAPLSKRTGSKSVQDLRAAGYLPGAVNNYLARLGHTYDDNGYLEPERLAAAFAMERLHKSPARFDEAQLNYWQHQAVRQAESAALWAWVGDGVRARVPVAQRDAFIEAVRDNLTFPGDAEHWARVVYDDAIMPAHGARAVIDKAGQAFYDAARRALEARGTDFRAIAGDLKVALGIAGKALFQPLRAALTGELDGPEMARLLPLMGKERAQARLASASKMAEGV